MCKAYCGGCLIASIRLFPAGVPIGVFKFLCRSQLATSRCMLQAGWSRAWIIYMRTIHVRVYIIHGHKTNIRNVTPFEAHLSSQVICDGRKGCTLAGVGLTAAAGRLGGR